MISKATASDIDAVSSVYEHIHTAEEAGETTTGWIRGVYPERETALAALARGDLFVQTDIILGKELVVGTAILNRIQVDVYKTAPWKYDVPDSQVMVMHTLVIDTNAANNSARGFYKKLGYDEIDIVPCEFNGISDVKLVLLEKRI